MVERAVNRLSGVRRIATVLTGVIRDTATTRDTDTIQDTATIQDPATTTVLMMDSRYGQPGVKRHV
jgi:hypothetical protein